MAATRGTDATRTSVGARVHQLQRGAGGVGVRVPPLPRRRMKAALATVQLVLALVGRKGHVLTTKLKRSAAHTVAVAAGSRDESPAATRA
jgi:hypothetical protein